MWSCQDFLEEPSDVSGQTEAVVFSTIETAEQVLAAPDQREGVGLVLLRPQRPGCALLVASVGLALFER